MDKPRLPGPTHRVVNVGRTGSGKTVAGIWHLSNMPLDRMPFTILNYKNDGLINSIHRAEHIGLKDTPKHPGVYIVSPEPDIDDAAVNEMLRRFLKRERVGVLADEGFMLGNLPAFTAMLTQGRSKHCPMIVNTQRPAWLSRFVFSEADFYQVFHLNDERDRKTVKSFVPANLDVKLPDYHSHWFDVGRNRLTKFSPVPEESKLLSIIDGKIKTQRTKL